MPLSLKFKKKVFILKAVIARKVDASRNTVNAIKAVWFVLTYAPVKVAKIVMKIWQVLESTTI